MPKLNIHSLNMYYELAGEGPTVVLVPGLADDHLGWKLMQVPALTAAGYRCLVFDNRDVGQTGTSPTPAYTIRQLADDTAALTAELVEEPFHLVGASMGGMIAQEFALHYPGRVRSLTLVGTTARTDAFLRHLTISLQTARRQCTSEEFYRTFALWLFTHRFHAAPEAMPSFMEQVAAHPFPQSVDCFLRQCEAILTHDSLDHLGSITAPTHVIAGAEDILIAPRYSRVLAAHISDATLTVMPEAGHALSWEKPNEFNRAVLAFLDCH